jgi:hypothetical protein
MSSYIFITAEGTTFLPGSESPTPDVENFQVLGFAQGKNASDAFENLLSQDTWLINSPFDRVTCYELRYDDFEKQARHFSIQDVIEFT